MRKLRHGSRLIDSRLLLACSLLLCLYGCSLDYGQAMADEPSAIPDTVVYNFRHTVVQHGRVLYELEAEEAEHYGSLGQIRLSQVHFSEFDQTDGSLVASGWADRAVFFTQSESADLSGRVVFSTSRDDIEVKTSDLSWDGQDKLLSTPADSLTTIRSGQSSLSGQGFEADARKRRFGFGQGVEGSFKPGEDQ